jgi:glycine cleavage system transcriptional repressor
MSAWYMLTLVGQDRPGIVAAITAALYQAGANLGEATMMRLGGNFSIMMMVRFGGVIDELIQIVEPVTERLALRVHVDPIEGALHQHLVPDLRITVSGADRAGIVAQVTGALAKAGFNILDLDSDVAGVADEPIYVMCIEGQALQGEAAVRAALDALSNEGIDVHVHAIDTLIG